MKWVLNNSAGVIKNKANLKDLMAAASLVILFKSDLNHQFFGPYDLEIWWMTLKNYRAPLLCYIKLCASFKKPSEFKLESQSGNAQFRSKLAIFVAHVTLKFDGWPWKTTGHLFYTLSSFLHHFKVISKYKLELQSGNALFCVTLKFDRGPWKTTGHF